MITILEPKPFYGDRDAITLENFIFDMKKILQGHEYGH